jgi:trk system potassium uptake protein TrkH
MGIVVLTVAILPFLGAGGAQLVRAEHSGPTADKLAPRIAQTAASLWLVYLILTVAQILLLWPAMGLFDAACHAFGTLSSGGYSTKNASIAHYDSAYVDAVVTVFMFLAGASFLLHYRALRGKGLPHLRDSEFLLYAGIAVAATLVITAYLHFGDHPDLERNPARYASFGGCFRRASFQVASVLSCTGFVTADFDSWPNVCRALLIVLMVIGACAGSTGGGVKCFRVLLLFRFGLREVKRLVRPHAVLPLRIGGKPVDSGVIAQGMGFLALYVVVLVIAVMLLAMILGSDPADGRLHAGETRSPVSANAAFMTALGAAASCLGNVGPGLGGVGPVAHYGHVPDAGKWLLMVLMLLGRLEIYAVLVLCVPLTWRR